jgi:peptidoglycan/xylan/chitin deacetylase (PgdA/CDA1 family)
LAVNLVSTVAVASGFTTLVRRRRQRRGDYRVYILEYHRVEDEPEREGVVSTKRFEDHLRQLTASFRFTTVAEAAEHLAAGPLLEDFLVLTFDDGYRDNHHCAWPVMRAFKVPGTIYITTGFLDGNPLWFDTARRSFEALQQRGGPLPEAIARALRQALGDLPQPGQEVNRLKYAAPQDRLRVTALVDDLSLVRRPASTPLSWDEARELHAAGIELGGHTVSHPILARLGHHQQEVEIQQSQMRLAEELGATPTTFAMPNGSKKDFDRNTLDLLQRLRFLAACTTMRGSNRPGCDPYTLRRIGIGSDSPTLLSARLAGLFDQGLRRVLRRG